MIKKMLAKYEQRLRGWDDPEFKQEILHKMRDNIDDSDWVDVANLAMMLHRFQQEGNNNE